MQFAILTIAIIGMFGMSINAYADQPSDKPQACNNDNAKHVGNKHCDGSGTGAFTECDGYDSDTGHESDGVIDADELVDWIVDNGKPVDISAVKNNIKMIEESIPSNNPNGVIDSNKELSLLNEYLDGLDIPICA
ncbi:hypothetical protein NsoK4_08985 [Nitrosopumilus sp. K4]|uniref:hypothetical protein n=1 Tax=Nitrosopumilus sp. K4 TaxID=2795383 RepID=UPI001BA5BEBC|nr:hypothetical protein [Nitrosopumilus sp. K4]QUC64541.1 hypothetical protein NsoK4_08985 [Nitrosopumilus sp. K4]